ncbi:hypothetical protein SK571_11040 [Lentzea sp. BCCO 10_0798]|uniref:Uncharacterized protein n=1 Tax=Lentzea kristufekii TaxID=3095430 RepID=A0ABU4TPQ2_9PSEU|nr:hypothetical protein [Lentzea sp. BCCO 10_0798]MDX8049917.1 hypothetical protein [Lentzea sp. BCCO 10_0798]
MTALRAELMRLGSDLVLLGFAFAAAVLGLAGSPDVVLVAALYPAVRYTYELRWGTMARAVLLAGRQPVLVARVVAALLGGAVIGSAGVLASLVPWATTDAEVLVTAPLAAVSGLFAGVVLRNYFLAPLAVVLVHIAAELAVVEWPVLGPEMWVLGVGALLITGVVAWLSLSLRDL